MDSISQLLVKRIENALLQTVRTGDKEAALSLVAGNLNSISSALKVLRENGVIHRVTLDEKAPVVLGLKAIESEIKLFNQ